MEQIPTEVMEFKNGEIVWHKGFKMKVEYCGISLPDSKFPDKRWYMVQLPNGGMHETQMIEKLTNQDIEYFKNKKK